MPCPVLLEDSDTGCVQHCNYLPLLLEHTNSDDAIVIIPPCVMHILPSQKVKLKLAQ